MADITRQLRALVGADVADDEREDLEACERLAAALLTSDEPVGDVFEATGGGTTSTVGAESRRASSTPEKGRFLYRLTRTLAPGLVVELGAGFGVSGAYYVRALQRGGGRLQTIEGSPSRAAVAQRTIDASVPGLGTVTPGLFDDHLDLLAGADVVAVDGNHWHDPTHRYVNEALERGARPLVLVLDDINPTATSYDSEMRQAWAELSADRRFALSGVGASFGVLATEGSALSALPAPRRWPRAGRRGPRR